MEVQIYYTIILDSNLPVCIGIQIFVTAYLHKNNLKALPFNKFLCSVCTNEMITKAAVILGHKQNFLISALLKRKEKEGPRAIYQLVNFVVEKPSFFCATLLFVLITN